MRADLPRGVQAAMIVHAAGESGPAADDAYACALEVPTEAALCSLAAELWLARVPHVLVVEPDPPYLGQAMAVGVRPARKEGALKRLLRPLRLLA